MANEIRFAVGTQDDLRSSVWRLWSNKNDLYLAARSTAGLSKISFHASGICRVAVTSRTPRAALANWRQPAELVPGVTCLFSIFVPPVVARQRFTDKLPPA